MVETGQIKNVACSNGEVCAGKTKTSAWFKGKTLKKQAK